MNDIADVFWDTPSKRTRAETVNRKLGPLLRRWKDVLPVTLLFRLLTIALSSIFTVSAQPASVAEARFVRLGGIEQWITIRGTDRAKPVLLVVHGGPGEAQSPLVSTYAPLEREFVVVHWDQRGAGKTLAHGEASRQETSLELIVADGIELAEYIRAYLRTSNVILIGHSWGSFVGVHIVKKRPELFRAYVGTGQVVSWRAMVEAQYRYTLDRARAEPNGPAVEELGVLGVPDPDKFDQYLVMRRWLNRYLSTSDVEWLPRQDALLRSALTAVELKVYRQAFQTMTGLSSTVFSMDLPALGFDFRLPVFLIHGNEDRITPASLAVSYLEKIDAPIKRVVLISGAGHFAAMTHMQQFAVALGDSFRQLPR